MDGHKLTFKAPCDCISVEKLKVCYVENATQKNRLFTMKDAHGNDLTGLGNLFSQGAYVDVVLDTVNGFAYLQNAGTNKYLEQKITPVDNLESDRSDLPLSARMGSELNKKLNMRYNPETDMVEIFYNGVWNVWENGNMQNLFAYNYGDENAVVTGGWSGYAYKDTGSGSSVKLPTVTKESNRMKIGITGTSSAWYFGSVFAEKPIDLTNYKTIEIVVGTASLNSNTGGGGFSVATTKANNYTNAKIVNITGTGTYTLDVSSLSGSHYLCLSVRAGASTAEQYYYISSVKLIK